MVAYEVKFWASSETVFFKREGTLEAETSGSGKTPIFTTVLYVAIGGDKKVIKVFCSDLLLYYAFIQKHYDKSPVICNCL